MANQLTFETWERELAEKINKSLNTPEEVLKWAYGNYENDIVYACSFGAEGVVLCDLISRVNERAEIIFLDTELHFKETYELINKMKERYPLMNIKMVKPVLTLEEQAARFGEELWKGNPNLCCSLRKIQPLERELQQVKAWISGLRRDQSPARSKLEKVNRDDKFKRIKICPIIDWTWDDIWTYITLFNLPYNLLHDKNYPSIGCEKCTAPAENQADTRSGRWVQTGKTECGLHVNMEGK